jgi:uncharacterized protein (TIGR03067 family)
MKSIILPALLFFCSITGFTQTRSLKDIIGKWQIPGNYGTMEFIDSTHIITTMQGKKVGSGTYVMDFSKNPIWLDVTIGQGGRSSTIKQIVEFTDDDTIRWQSSTTNERPKSFQQTAYGAAITLTRMKE